MTPPRGPGLGGGYSQERVTLRRQLHYITCKNGSSVFYQALLFLHLTHSVYNSDSAWHLETLQRFVHSLSLKPQSSSPRLLFHPGFFSLSAIPQCLTWHNPVLPHGPHPELVPVLPEHTNTRLPRMPRYFTGCPTWKQMSRCITACERAQTDHRLHGLSYSRH